jgi:hypothetical protein
MGLVKAGDLAGGELAIVDSKIVNGAGEAIFGEDRAHADGVVTESTRVVGVAVERVKRHRHIRRG